MPPRIKGFRRTGKVTPAKTDEVEYRNTILAILRGLNLDLMSTLGDLLEEDTLDPVAIQLALADVRARNVPSDAEALATASRFVENVNQRNQSRISAIAISSGAIPSGLSLRAIIREENLLPILQASVFENTRLIQNVPEKMMDDVQSLLMRFITNPDEFFETDTSMGLIGQIQEKMNIAERRARNIAVDQVHKINASLSKERFLQLGSPGYSWLTAGDERVRATHRVLNGHYFLWASVDGPNPIAPDGKPFRDPPPFAPGMEIMCRCDAQPVLPLEQALLAGT